MEEKLQHINPTRCKADSLSLSFQLLHSDRAGQASAKTQHPFFNLHPNSPIPLSLFLEPSSSSYSLSEAARAAKLRHESLWRAATLVLLLNLDFSCSCLTLGPVSCSLWREHCCVLRRTFPLFALSRRKRLFPTHLLGKAIQIAL